MNKSSFFLSICMIAASQLAFAQADEPRVQKEHLVYQGAFRVSDSGSGAASLEYAMGTLGYNPANNSLFITGHDQYQRTAEISIPELVNSTSASALRTASFLQSPRDATEGKLTRINPGSSSVAKVGGYLVFDGKLYLSAYTYYDASGSASSSHFVRSTDLSAASVQGPVKVGSNYPGFVSGHMALIPPEWQSAFGGPALTGNCCLSITSFQSNGPAASVFDPRKVGAGGSVPAQMLIGYPYGRQLGPGVETQNPYFNLTTNITGLVFPNGTRSVLFFGRHGTGRYCYGESSACGDPSGDYKGNHAYPYKYQVWAYDANDMLDVKSGKMRPDQIQPYAMWNFELPFESGNGPHDLGGAAYDPKTSTIYLSQLCATGSCVPIIHAFKVSVAEDLTVPAPPSGVTVQ